ncbi:MAG TPA: CobW family GTP-binding protein [Bacillota bacterium]|nr:CobW family GTP-binding protein [Bacillota bacterium]
MIKLILLTGFLGTGKTTLLKQLLNEFKNEKIGVVVNEFGQISIDGTLVEKSGVIMTELTNGSIFCSCIKENFLNSLISLSGEDISYLFIEASGLADPANMSQIICAISPKTAVPYDYRGSVCIVDAETFLDYYELLPALHQQVAYSGAIILNKVDLVKEEVLADTLKSLASINSSVSIYITTYCNVEYRRLIEELKAPARPEEESSNTVENRPVTFVLAADQVLPGQALKCFLEKLSEAAYRIKGFAKTESGTIYISGVKNHLEISPWAAPVKKTEIMIISSVGIRIMSAITNGLKGELKGLLNIGL